MTGRQLIQLSLRAINTIGVKEVPTYAMFEDARKILNLLLESWSAEELMPYSFLRYELGLFAEMPSYTIKDGAIFDTDSVCLRQQPSSGGTQSLTINGVLATGGVATMDVPRPVMIASTADDSGRVFTITGTNIYDDILSERIVGPKDISVHGARQYKTVTAVSIDDDSAGIVSVGTDYIVGIRRPLVILSAFIRDSDGLDEMIIPINRERYIEIADKDEAGKPVEFYYRRSYSSGEIHVHPVPASGLSIDPYIESAIEHITNGSFASSSAWTLPAVDSQWAITGGKLVRTPALSDTPILGDEKITNGDLATNADSWTLESQWAWDTGKLLRTPLSGDGEPILGDEILANPSFEEGSGDWTHTSYAYYEGNPKYDWALQPTVSSDVGIQQILAAETLEQGAEYACGANTTGDNTHSLFKLYFNAQLVSSSSAIGSLGGPVVYDVDGSTAFAVRRDSVGGMTGTAEIADCSLKKITGYAPLASPASVYQNNSDMQTPLTEGASYQLAYTISGCTVGNLTPKVGGTAGTTQTTNDTFTKIIESGAIGAIQFLADEYFDGSIDGISLKEVTGYEPIGADSAKQLSADLAVAFTGGGLYRLAFDVTSFNAGTCVPSIGDTDGETVDADGSYEMDITCGSGADFELAASTDFEGTFDNISIKELSSGITGTAEYTLFLDLWLPFVAVDLDAIDKDINLPNEYLLAIYWNLAAELAPSHGKDVLPYVYIRARQTKDVIKKINALIPRHSLSTPVSIVDNQFAANQN